jgi:hypothetical protein
MEILEEERVLIDLLSNLGSASPSPESLEKLREWRKSVKVKKTNLHKKADDVPARIANCNVASE